jgi:hypothetical protein
MFAHSMVLLGLLIALFAVSSAQQLRQQSDVNVYSDMFKSVKAHSSLKIFQEEKLTVSTEYTAVKTAASMMYFAINVYNDKGCGSGFYSSQSVMTEMCFNGAFNSSYIAYCGKLLLFF